MYLGIDLGTAALKAAIYDTEGSLVEAAEESYPARASIADFDPAMWWDVCQRVVRRITASRGADVAAVGVVGQMHGVVLVDGRGRPVRQAVLWPDHRADSVLAEFAQFDNEHVGVLGNPLVPGMAGPILTWLARNEPDSLRDADRVVQPKDWLRMQLSDGQALTDPSDASATLLYDVRRDDWSDDVCEAVGVERDLLPRIYPSSSVVGRLDPVVSEGLNLGVVPVVVGSGDAAAALLGAGIEEPGMALINTGTGGQVMTPMDSPVAGRRVGPGIHQYRSASEATSWYAMAAVANAGLALGWVREIVGYDWDQVYDTAGSVLGSHATDPVFLPFLAGEREPSRDALKGAAWNGLTLAHDREALVRSALRGVAFYLGSRAKALMDITDVSAAIMSGGAARHVQWVELLATILGIDIRVSTDAHLSVRGAARLAARGVGQDLPPPLAGERVAPRRGGDIDGQLQAFDEAVTRHFQTSG